MEDCIGTNLMKSGMTLGASCMNMKLFEHEATSTFTIPLKVLIEKHEKL